MGFYEQLWPLDPVSYRHAVDTRWDEWRRTTGRPLIAAEIGAEFAPHRHTYADLILGSSTLLECFQRAFSFYNANNPHTKYMLDIEPHRIRTRVVYPSGLGLRQDDAEYRLSLLASVVRWVVPATDDDIVMTLTVPSHDHHIRLAGTFATPVQIGAPVNSIVMHPKVMAAPIWGSPHVASQLGKFYATDLAAAAAPRTHAGRVESAIRMLLVQGKFGIKAVAEEFGVTPRTLQRYLAEESSSFHKVAEETKRRLCGELIQNPEIALDEMHVRLGYSNPSNFARAFRQWFGTTPSRMRRGLHLRTESGR